MCERSSKSRAPIFIYQQQENIYSTWLAMWNTLWLKCFRVNCWISWDNVGWFQNKGRFPSEAALISNTCTLGWLFAPRRKNQTIKLQSKVRKSWNGNERCLITFSKIMKGLVDDVPNHVLFFVEVLYVPWSKVAILGMVIPPLIGILIMGI